ncbi:MAG TPA: hypothetical protein VJM07_04315, partial [Gaiella sp.]|nr:hypothetical protein [Gaiella sp.]
MSRDPAGLTRGTAPPVGTELRAVTGAERTDAACVSTLDPWLPTTPMGERPAAGAPPDTTTPGDSRCEIVGALLDASCAAASAPDPVVAIFKPPAGAAGVEVGADGG